MLWRPATYSWRVIQSAKDLKIMEFTVCRLLGESMLEFGLGQLARFLCVQKLEEIC